MHIGGRRMDDLISRQVAIDAIVKLPNAGIHWFVSAEGAIKALEALPSAEPERKSGHWVGCQEYCNHLTEQTGEKYITTGIENMIYCDQCWQANGRKSDFCPNCGADMREGRKE